MGCLMSPGQHRERKQRIAEARKHDIVTKRGRGSVKAGECRCANARVQGCSGARRYVIGKV